MADRFIVLQKKLDDLRNVHEDGKKTHHIETDRLKSELARCQKTITDQTAQIDKQKKHANLLEARVHDLKKTADTSQAEITALKTKLKQAEAQKHTDIQAVESKHRDATLDIKKATHAAELKFREQITQLEKSLASEHNQRESLESCLHDLKSKLDTDIQASAKQAEVKLANFHQQLSSTRQSFAQEREDFISRLAHCNSLLSHAARQYALLASSSIPSSIHRKLKRLHHSNEIKLLRLERKLANAEDQVSELAHLVRQSNQRNDLLKSQLDDALDQISIYDSMLDGFSSPRAPEPSTFDWKPPAINKHDDPVLAQLDQLLSRYYNLRCEQLFFAYTCLDKELSQTSSLANQQTQDLANAHTSHKIVTTNLKTTQQECSSLFNQLTELQTTHTSLKRTCLSLEAQVSTLQSQQQQLTVEHEAEKKKDKETVQRLTGVVQKTRMAEDALRAEIERLLAELADAERYQEAYNSLSEQVNDLLARNQLAEEEAERLGKFNAEILGHNNPSQRIAYVDRVRRELAEAKHKIILLSREQETIVELNADLQHELDMYKSVMDTADRPRTHITRVQRVPLSNVTRSLDNNVSSTTRNEPAKLKTDLDTVPGEMTLDELMY